MKSILFKPSSHDKVFDLISENGNFYNDDIDLVSKKGTGDQTVSVFLHEDGFITGIELFDNEHKEEIVEMFKPITLSVNN